MSRGKPIELEVSKIAGNVSDEIKRAVGHPALFYKSEKNFGDNVLQAVETTEIFILPKAEEPLKDECRVVFKATVTEDMVNLSGNLHGGCSAFLIDVCSTYPLTVLTAVKTGVPMPGVSQSLNMVYHSPAVVGDELRIVCTSMALGSRASSIRAEIWNDTKHRLVASGVHIKMDPSPVPKL